jgi:hypothetical protein
MTKARARRAFEAGRAGKFSDLAILIFPKSPPKSMRKMRHGGALPGNRRPPPCVGTTHEGSQMFLQPLFDAVGSLLPGLPALPVPSTEACNPSAIRQQRRAADWNQQLARAYAYQVERAHSPEEAAALEAEYEQRMNEGPDFLHYRRKSDFMEAPEITLDRNARARLMTNFRAMRRGSWETKTKGKHSGVISRTAVSVFEAIMYLAQKYGRLFPSLEGLMHLACCCKQSVVTALNDLERLGFITRHRRKKTIMTPLGLKTVQATNAYEVHEPNTGIGRLALALFTPKSESNNQAARIPNSSPNRGQRKDSTQQGIRKRRQEVLRAVRGAV